MTGNESYRRLCKAVSRFHWQKAYAIVLRWHEWRKGEYNHKLKGKR